MARKAHKPRTLELVDRFKETNGSRTYIKVTMKCFTCLQERIWTEARTDRLDMARVECNGTKMYWVRQEAE